MRFLGVLYLALLFALALVVQTALLPLLLPSWALGGADLCLMVAVHVAVSRGRAAGMAGGVALGYLQDALSRGILGVNGGALLAAGFVGGLLREQIYVRSFAQRLGAVMGAVAAALGWKLLLGLLFDLPSPSLLSPVFPLTFLLATFGAMVLTRWLDRLEERLGVRPGAGVRLDG